MHNAQSIESQVVRLLKDARVRGILVAVSGGADSVALLRVCHAVSARMQIRVEAANCNFHLRGEESDRDSSFVEALCSRLGIRLHSLDYDVAKYMADHPGLSTEMACRELRYADFHRIASERGMDRIAVAHNADDDIETMLLNMLRGSGCRGLKGMDFDTGKIIRPLLKISRKQIEEYLAAIGQDYITDSSNLTSEYRRNFIRREVLPLLEQRWPGARKALGRTVEIMKEDSEIVESHYQEQLQRLTRDDGSLDVYADGVRVGTILRFLEPWGGNSEIAEEILEATRRPFAERTWKLDSHTAILERDRLVIGNGFDEEEISLEWQQLEMNDETMKMVKANRDHHIAYLPNGPEAYEFRRPKTGDRMSPLGMRGSRLVSDIISDAKLDRKAKSKICILSRKSDGEIIWIPGLKRSRHDLISDKDESCNRCSVASKGLSPFGDQ